MDTNQMIGLILSFIIIFFVAKSLINGVNSIGVLLLSGLLMLILSYLLELPFVNQVLKLKKSTNLFIFDIFQFVTEQFSLKMSGVGLLIMAVSGFVQYMQKIGASDSLVSIITKPIHKLKKYPYITSILVIPIGQLLFICVPSATGLGLLLMASLFPVLLKLGISRLTAISVISATTMIEIGPSMSVSIQSSEMIGIDVMSFFIEYQTKIALISTPFIMLIYFIINKYLDKKIKDNTENIQTVEIKKTPKIYSVLPILPLFFLIFFSDMFLGRILPENRKIILQNPSTAVFISVIISLIFEMIKIKNIKIILYDLNYFWTGMGNTFSSIVVLLVSAEIFSKGLVSLGFIDSIIQGASILNFGMIMITVIFTLFVFLSSMLMGSGNAAFFSFSPLVQDISTKFGGNMISLLLPIALASTMGRTASPVTGVIVATSKAGNVKPMDIAKRNLIPMLLGIIFQIIISIILF